MVDMTILFDKLLIYEAIEIIRVQKVSNIFPANNVINDLSIPSIHDTLPYIVDLQKSLSLSFKWSKGRTNVTIVLGIPTVKRDKQSYLQVMSIRDWSK